MSEAEATILLNQGHIMTALAVLVPSTLAALLIERAETTAEYVDKVYQKNPTPKV